MLKNWDYVEWIHADEDRDEWQAAANGFLHQLS
jgi:hypothetical protein